MLPRTILNLVTENSGQYQRKGVIKPCLDAQQNPPSHIRSCTVFLTDGILPLFSHSPQKTT